MHKYKYKDIIVGYHATHGPWNLSLHWLSWRREGWHLEVSSSGRKRQGSNICLVKDRRTYHFSRALNFAGILGWFIKTNYSFGQTKCAWWSINENLSWKNENLYNQSCPGQTKVLAHNFPNVSYVASCVNQIWLMWANRTNRKVQKGPQREQ